MSSSNPNVVRATQTNIGIANLCLFCYKSAGPPSSHVNVDLEKECEQTTKPVIIVEKFLKLLGRFVGQEFNLFGRKNGHGLKCSNKRLSYCDDCREIISAFCETYEKLKCLEVQLEWKLRTLVDIMKLASRVPSRNKQLRRVFVDAACDDDGYYENCALSPVRETMTGELESFRSFKHDLIKKCTSRLSKSQPRVLVQRLADTEDGPTSNTSVSNRSKEGDNIPEPLTYSGIGPFLGMIVSFTAVVMLGCSPVYLKNSPNARRSEDDDDSVIYQLPELDLNLSDDEEDDRFDADAYTTFEPEEDDVPNGEDMDNLSVASQLSSRDYVADIKGEIIPTSSPNLVQGILDHCGSQGNDDEFCDPVDDDIVSHEGRNNSQGNGQSIAAPIPDVMSTHSMDNLSFAGEVKPYHSDSMDMKTASKMNPRENEAVKSPLTCYSKSSSLKQNMVTAVNIFRCGVCNISFKLYRYLRDHTRRSKRHKMQLDLQRLRTRKTGKRDSKKAERSNGVPVGKGKAFQGGGVESEEVPELSLNTETVEEGSHELFGSGMLVEQDNRSSNTAAGRNTGSIRRACKISPFKCYTKASSLMQSMRTAVNLFHCGICNVSFKLYKSLRDHKTRSKRHHNLHKLLMERLRCLKTRKVGESQRECKKGTKYVGEESSFHGGDDKSERMEGQPAKTEESQKLSGPEMLVEQESPPKSTPQRYNLRNIRKRSYKLDDDDEQDNDETESCAAAESDSASSEESFAASDGEAEIHLAPSPRQMRKKINMRSTDPKQIMLKSQEFNETKLLPVVPMTEESEDNERDDNSKGKKIGVVEHSKSVTPTRNKLRCPVPNCKLWFRTVQTLDTHKKLHGNFKCNFCDEIKDYAPNLALHETRHASADEIKNLANSKSGKGLHCSRCFRHFERKERFIMHFLKVHLDLSGACRMCPICSAESVTKDKFNRKQHFISHHKTDGVDPSNILECDQCPAYFLRSTQLIHHKYRIHFNEKCPHCGKKYIGKKSVVRTFLKHMDQVHPEHNAFPHLTFRCTRERCRGRSRFATEQELTVHHKDEHDLQEQVMKCEKCDKEFPGLKRLKCHVKDVHGPPIHVCPECGRAFKSLLGLHNHKVYHKGPDAWKFQCSTCGRKFAARQKLDQHMRTHTKEKPFVCQFCGTQYAHRHNWRNHVKAQHPDELAQTEDIAATSSSAFGKGMPRKGSKKGDCILAGVRQT